MPIFEFECKKCGKNFEILVLRRDEAETVFCPVCKCKDLGNFPPALGEKLSFRLPPYYPGFPHRRLRHRVHPVHRHLALPEKDESARQFAAAN